MDESLVVSTRSSGPVSVLSLRGELEIESAHVLTEAVRSTLTSGRGELVVDLGEVTFVDSSGLRALITAMAEVEAAGSSFGLTNVRPFQLRLFAITGLDELFQLQDPPDVEARATGSDARSPLSA